MRSLVLFFTIAVALSGCIPAEMPAPSDVPKADTTSAPDPTPIPKPEPEPESEPLPAPPPPPPTPKRLEDAKWSITALNGSPTNTALRLTIAGQFISGRGPCNQITGNYLGTGPIFDVQILTITSLPCGLDAFEDAVLKNLLEAGSATISEEGILSVIAPDGTVTLTFKPVYDG